MHKYIHNLEMTTMFHPIVRTQFTDIIFSVTINTLHNSLHCHFSLSLSPLYPETSLRRCPRGTLHYRSRVAFCWHLPN